ncbi:hypothetical protein GA0061100_11844 [Rhizobium hainanense]|uniref:Uncharacterized protein n=1 Tax=Rhizobium hainanense TaxID=52131 RepID=A0A1C3WGL2_9HYPH|nr:hypothetical protein GA0061100_11844 [Rhizobium hainanense]
MDQAIAKAQTQTAATKAIRLMASKIIFVVTFVLLVREAVLVLRSRSTRSCFPSSCGTAGEKGARVKTEGYRPPGGRSCHGRLEWRARQRRVRPAGLEAEGWGGGLLPLLGREGRAFFPRSRKEISPAVPASWCCDRSPAKGIVTGASGNEPIAWFRAVRHRARPLTRMAPGHVQ